MVLYIVLTNKSFSCNLWLCFPLNLSVAKLSKVVASVWPAWWFNCRPSYDNWRRSVRPTDRLSPQLWHWCAASIRTPALWCCWNWCLSKLALKREQSVANMKICPNFILCKKDRTRQGKVKWKRVQGKYTSKITEVWTEGRLLWIVRRKHLFLIF